MTLLSGFVQKTIKRKNQSTFQGLSSIKFIIFNDHFILIDSDLNTYTCNTAKLGMLQRRHSLKVCIHNEIVKLIPLWNSVKDYMILPKTEIQGPYSSEDLYRRYFTGQEKIM